jgi:hypothetical protein
MFSCLLICLCYKLYLFDVSVEERLAESSLYLADINLQNSLLKSQNLLLKEELLLLKEEKLKLAAELAQALADEKSAIDSFKYFLYFAGMISVSQIVIFSMGSLGF